MPIVTRVTPGIVDVRISDAAHQYWKHVEDKMFIKFLNITSETGLWFMPQMINKLLENGKNNIFY